MPFCNPESVHRSVECRLNMIVFLYALLLTEKLLGAEPCLVCASNVDFFGRFGGVRHNGGFNRVNGYKPVAYCRIASTL